ncbi:hypothetical protein QUF70_15400, partial [Desulfobacterales bacterium HSG17]|nr:hypothetical protein [Desulfobacterales bacterium HSG17]
LAVLFLTTGIAAATDFSMSGSYYVRGQFYDNAGGTGTPAAPAEAYGNYDHQMLIDTTWKMDDATMVFARFDIRDQTWATEGTTSESTNNTLPDSNIAVERVWGSHTFGNGGRLFTGLMSGGAFGTSFGDAEYDAYRVKYSQPTSMGTLLLIVQKTVEGGASTNADDDAVDEDGYMAGLLTKFGDINVQGLLVYVDYEIVDGSVTKFHLALDGPLGDALSFDGEFQYHTYDDHATNDDADIWGIYGQVSYVSGPATFSVLGAYGSYDDDDDAGFSFGDDFEAGGAMIMGDDMELVGADLGAGALGAFKVSYAVNDQLTLSGYLGYWAGSSETGQAYDDADVYEISGQGAYAITANLVYSFGIGYAELDDYNSTDPDEAINAYHKLSFSF